MRGCLHETRCVKGHVMVHASLHATPGESRGEDGQSSSAAT